MYIQQRITILIAAAWWDELSDQAKYDYLKSHPHSNIKLTQVHPNSNRYDIINTDTQEHLGNVSAVSGHPFIDLIMLKPEHKGKGLAKHIYNALERKLKRPIVPSPLGLSETATRVWQKRLAKLPAEHAKQLLDESFKLGMGYGIKNPQHIIDRLQPLLPDWQPPKD